MVPILDGNSEHVAHARREQFLFGEKKSLDLINALDQITEITPYLRTYIWITI